MSTDEVLFRFIGPVDADGKPTEFVPGIPAKDLTAKDVARVERRGLLHDLKNVAIYEAVKPAPKKAADSAAKEG